MAWVAATLIGVATGCQTAAPPPPPAVAPEQWRPLALERTQADVAFLASDELEGRGVGTPGIDRAAEHIAAELRKAGLQPVEGAQDGFFQPFTMRGEMTIEPATALSLAGSPQALDTDFRPLSLSAAKGFAGPVAFVGYAVRDTARGYDDFDGVDVAGRVALALRYEPHTPEGKSRLTDGGDWSDQSSLVTKAANAAAAGASALLVVNPPTYHGEEDRLIPFSRRFGRTAAEIPVIHVTQATANRLLAAGGVRDLASLQAAIDVDFKPATAMLDDAVRAEGTVATSQKQIAVKNVLAALPGRGRNADEWIVVGAHYDHLGLGGRGSLLPTTRAIHNGADDNASGTAALLELARRLAAQSRGDPLGRSVLFLFFSAEESGLLGSDHFVNNPLVPLDDIVAMLNLDMVGRVKDSSLAVGGRDSAPAFESMAETLDAASPLQFTRMTRSTFGASDHVSFMTKKIPSLFFFSGLHADYHRPTDDVEKINFEGIADVIDLAEATVRELASMPRQPYTATTRPARGASTGSAATQTGDAAPRPQLGIIPSYTEDETGPEGIKLSGTTPGTAAAIAGLRENDVIQAMNGRRMRTLEDLMEFLDGAKVGETITLSVLRGGESLDIPVTLKARGASAD